MKLEDLKPGDQVIQKSYSPFTDDKIVVVERRTKTQIITKNRRFRVSDGYECGKHDRWGCNFRLITATPDQIAELERRQQIKQDQRSAHRLALKVSTRARECSTAAAAIPHLEAALAALDSSAPEQ